MAGCVGCGLAVEPRNAGRPRLYCLTCRPLTKQQLALMPRPKVAQTKACRHCGGAFTTYGLAAYCGQVCNRAAAKRRNDAVTARNWARPLMCCASTRCGKSFTPVIGQRQIKYCSSQCRQDAKNAQQSGSTHSRRARKYGVASEHIKKERVFEADGWCCYLCGCDTPRELMGSTEPTAPELEHVVPLSKGGTHTRGNVRCACRRCNAAKGANTPGGEGNHFEGLASDTGRPLIREKNPGKEVISKWQA